MGFSRFLQWESLAEPRRGVPPRSSRSYKLQFILTSLAVCTRVWFHAIPPPRQIVSIPALSRAPGVTMEKLNLRPLPSFVQFYRTCGFMPVIPVVRTAPSCPRCGHTSFPIPPSRQPQSLFLSL